MADFFRSAGDAYRQLRELLTTFRLTLQRADLPSHCMRCWKDLQVRPGQTRWIAVLPTLALDAQMQVHLLRKLCASGPERH